MPKGSYVSETDFKIIDRELKKHYGSIKETSEATRWGNKTVSRVKKAKGSYEKYQVLRAEDTDKRRKNGYAPKQTSTFQTPEQDMHDMLREARNIKNILLAIAEELGVKCN